MVVLTLDSTCGPLFLARELFGATADPAAVHHMEVAYPQFFKKHQGWRLAVEEVYHLLHLSVDAGTKVDLATEAVQQQYRVLSRVALQACYLYHELSSVHAYKLRHGSQFGAQFIGYRGVQSRHSETLFFLGPLSPLEVLAATRVAGSVGKRAVVCKVQLGGNAEGDAVVQLCEVSVERDATKGSRSVPPTKKIKGERTGVNHC